MLTQQNQKISKDFSFKDQIKRAVLSISNNIAEGFEYSNNNEFIKFLRYAKGSTEEAKNCLLFAVKVNFVIKNDIQLLINTSASLGGQIGNLIKYLVEKRTSTPKPPTRNP